MEVVWKLTLSILIGLLLVVLLLRMFEKAWSFSQNLSPLSGTQHVTLPV